MQKTIIAIDGTAASGKGTIAKMVAQHFQLSYLDTGLSYRAVAYQLISNNLSLDNEILALEQAKHINFAKLDTEKLSTTSIGNNASKIAVFPSLRKFLVNKQREFAENAANGAVLDGRDIGSIVCPNATVKLYIDAEIKIRAQRRFLQHNPNARIGDYSAAISQLITELTQRDERDKNRDNGALIKLKSAYLIETTNLTIEESFQKACAIIKNTINSCENQENRI